MGILRNGEARGVCGALKGPDAQRDARAGLRRYSWRDGAACLSRVPVTESPIVTDPTEIPVAANDEAQPASQPRPLSDAARRALAEATERREAAQAKVLDPEHGGPRGPEPTRYGDWEKKGLAIDF